MATSISPNDLSCASVAALPLIHARLRPCASRTRPQQDLVAVGRQRVLREPRTRGRAIRDVEAGRELGALGSGAKLPHLEAVAKQEADGVEQDRLAGAGFPGEHGESLAKATSSASTTTKLRMESDRSINASRLLAVETLGRCAPVEFLAQRREIVVAFGVEEARPERRALEQHAVALSQREVTLPVAVDALRRGLASP
jgi:hypothetical protein